MCVAGGEWPSSNSFTTLGSDCAAHFIPPLLAHSWLPVFTGTADGCRGAAGGDFNSDLGAASLLPYSDCKACWEHHRGLAWPWQCFRLGLGAFLHSAGPAGATSPPPSLGVAVEEPLQVLAPCVAAL